MPIRWGIVGGGPSALFLYRALLHSGRPDLTVQIFEAGKQIGAGMPYSDRGAGIEHVTNISGNEIPALEESVVDWISSRSLETLDEFDLDRSRLTEYKVLPRILFGQYLADQFDRYLKLGRDFGIQTDVWLKTRVTDVRDKPDAGEVAVILPDGTELRFDVVVLCTGHIWPRTHEGKNAGYFDSPYPPDKLLGLRNHPVAIRGASLTAIDAVRTLARQHGEFVQSGERALEYRVRPDAENFKLVLHSREGFLPGIRFHLEDPRLQKRVGLSEERIEQHRRENEGFISLDFLFEYDFKQSFREEDPQFYERIKDLNLEAFVELMTRERERFDPFDFFRKEYREAAESIRDEESIYWKERLAILSFSLNRPAKHFSAEDMLRLQKVLMPLISVVIAFTPQSSCEELIALQEAGRLELIAAGNESEVEPHPEGGILYRYSSESADARELRFKTFVDCVGQQPLSYRAFPFRTLKDQGAVSPAYVRFRSLENAQERLNAGENDVTIVRDEAWLRVPGVAINDHFEAINADGEPNPRLYVMAVPLMGGHNPDYSGLDFCEEASGRIVEHAFRTSFPESCAPAV